MLTTGTHINYYLVCKRKLWLFANGISMENTSELVYEGSLIHEHSYRQRSSKYTEIELDGIKIDFYDPKERVVHEVKKSSKFHETHIWQLKYYLWILERNGIEGASGVLEYPKERKTEEVYLSQPDRDYLQEIILDVQQLIHKDECPALINKPRCKNCSYYDFCYAGESSNESNGGSEY